jgi:glycolate oxidase iron-sulfur subunit
MTSRDAPSRPSDVNPQAADPAMRVHTTCDGFAGEPQPRLQDLDRCTRCGLCEQACPTYRILGVESDSPRGRVFLMKEVAEGKAAIDLTLATHIYRCLGCRACETACPAGVPYGRLLEAARFQIERRAEIAPQRRGWRRFRHVAFETIIPRRGLFRAVMAPARVLQRWPLLVRAAQNAAAGTRGAHVLRMIPLGQVPAASLRHALGRPRRLADGSLIWPAQGSRRARVGFFRGCVSDVLFAATQQATLVALTANGCEVVVPAGQWCCGALNVHAGERRHARAMARRNVRAFAKHDLDAIVVNAAGCGAVLKDYSSLEPGAEAEAFSQRVKDVTEYLWEGRPKAVRHPEWGRMRVTYQDACHLRHGQGVRDQPRRLLEMLFGHSYLELPDADQCCGAAGTYGLTQPRLAGEITRRKAEAIATLRPDVVAVTNPGCAMQIQAGLWDMGAPVAIRHVVDLLAEAYAGCDLAVTTAFRSGSHP